MQVDVAALSGDRFADTGEFKKSPVTIAPGAGEETDVVIRCNFEPARIVVDPDVQVFQLQRNAASYNFR
jgi:hypothetical protein